MYMYMHVSIIYIAHTCTFRRDLHNNINLTLNDKDMVISDPSATPTVTHREFLASDPSTAVEVHV